LRKAIVRYKEHAGPLQRTLACHRSVRARSATQHGGDKGRQHMAPYLCALLPDIITMYPGLYSMHVADSNSLALGRSYDFAWVDAEVHRPCIPQEQTHTPASHCRNNAL